MGAGKADGLRAIAPTCCTIPRSSRDSSTDAPASSEPVGVARCLLIDSLMDHWDQIYQQSRALRVALGGRQARPDHGKRPRLAGADDDVVDAVFSSSVCPSCLDFAPVGVACVRCGEVGVDVESRERTYRSPWTIGGVRALRALRSRIAKWIAFAAAAPDAVAASAEGWVRLRGRVRAIDRAGPVAVLERRRVGGQSVVTGDVADFELVDETGSVLIGAQALAVELLLTDLAQGQWRRQIVDGDAVVLVADVCALGDGPHRTMRRQVVSSVGRPALLSMGRA